MGPAPFGVCRMRDAAAALRAQTSPLRLLGFRASLVPMSTNHRDAIALTEDLNRNCHCVVVDQQALVHALESGPTTHGVYASIVRDQPHLFSASGVFLAREHLQRMEQVIGAIESVIASAPFQERALEQTAPIARFDPGTRGAFLGYDFHLGAEGPQLIEINTNAGGGLLNAALGRAQRACCAEVEAVLAGVGDATDVEQRFLEMFRSEFALQRGARELSSIAIVDTEPEGQYLYPEFLLFRELFTSAGLHAVIADPRKLVHENGKLVIDGQSIDLVYNRLTDFLLEEPGSAALRSAYLAGDVVVTPGPRAYALYADKRHLTVLSDIELLRSWGIDEATCAVLQASVPRAMVVNEANREQLWQERKQYFFKPLGGYGGKAAYRGDKLTRSVWAAIGERGYVAQRMVHPSRRTIELDGRQVPLKLDVRCYVYAGSVQLVAARLYEGQTTNFRTAGGGFAPVFTDAEPRGSSVATSI